MEPLLADSRHVEGPLPPEDAADARRRYPRGQGYAQDGLMGEPDEQRLFTEACLHGLRAKICDVVDSLNGYLPPVAAMARKVAGALEMPQSATT